MLHTPQEDRQLIEDAVAGSQNAFGKLMRAHIAAVFRFVNRMLHDEVAAEDVTQDAFIKAWKSLRTFDTNKKFSTWIFQIAKNTAIDYSRKRKIVLVSQVETDDGQTSTIESIPDAAPLPDQQVHSAQLAGHIRAAIDQLGPLHSTIVLLHIDEQLTFVEIAEVLGEPVDTIKSRYRRALLKLRELVAPN